MINSQMPSKWHMLKFWYILWGSRSLSFKYSSENPFFWDISNTKSFKFITWRTKKLRFKILKTAYNDVVLPWFIVWFSLMFYFQCFRFFKLHMWTVWPVHYMDNRRRSSRTFPDIQYSWQEFKKVKRGEYFDHHY